MDIRSMQYFLAVAREGSITRAAQSLHMTQPPLSRQLAELEQELGTKLFIRGPKRITLTPDGLLLRRRAEEMIDLMEKTRAELSGSGGDVQGEISIGAGESRGVALLARAAARLHALYPAVRYRIYSGDESSVTYKLENGLIDFGLYVGIVDVGRYDSMRLPVEDTWGVLMRRDSPLASKEAITAEDLWDVPLFLSHQEEARGALLQWLRKDTDELNIVLSSNLIYNASLFVEEGMGCVITLDGLVNTTGDSELCFRRLSPELKAELTLVWKKHQTFPRASREFLRLLREECNALPFS